MPDEGKQFDPVRDNDFDLMLVTCRRAQPPSDLALRKLYLQLPPLDPGWTESWCEVCTEAILIGVRQNEFLDGYGKDVLIVCMECAARIQKGTGGVVRHLGGG